MEIYKFKFEVVTPMFIGGASPNGEAEIRPPSIKGMLRWWFRVLGGNEEKEEEIFGSAGEGKGKSKFKLFLPETIKGDRTFDRNRYSRYDKPGKCPNKKVKINGIVYAGYSLTLGGNNRKAIPSGKNFEVFVSWKSGTRNNEKMLIAGLLWILGTIGGLGTRWRRGFGSVQINQNKSLSPVEADKDMEWVNQFKNGWETLKKILLDFSSGTSSSPWRLHKIYVWNKNFPTWEDALNEVASKMQEFRQCMNPDHDDAFKLLKYGIIPKHAPLRTAFGLPLMFRFRNVKGTALFQPENHERMASPIIFHIAKLKNSRFLPIVLKMKGLFLERKEKISVKGYSKPLPKPGDYFDGNMDDTLIREFVLNVLKPNTLEVSL